MLSQREAKNAEPLNQEKNNESYLSQNKEKVNEVQCVALELNCCARFRPITSPTTSLYVIDDLSRLEPKSWDEGSFVWDHMRKNRLCDFGDGCEIFFWVFIIT